MICSQIQRCVSRTIRHNLPFHIDGRNDVAHDFGLILEFSEDPFLGLLRTSRRNHGGGLSALGYKQALPSLGYLIKELQAVSLELGYSHSLHYGHYT